MLYIPADGETHLFVVKNHERALFDSPLSNIHHIKRLGKMVPAMEELGVRLPEKVGLEMDVLPVAFFRRIEALFPSVQWVDISGQIMKTRSVKSDFEIERLRIAGRELVAAFEHIGEFVKPGAEEYVVDAEFRRFLRLRGEHSLNRVRRWNMEFVAGSVSSGSSAAYPIAFDGPVGYPGITPATAVGSGRKRIAKNEPVMIDMVNGHDGYMVDMTRTFFTGNPDGFWLDAHSFIVELNGFIESMLAPGTKPSDIYKKVMERVEKAGFSESFMGSGNNQVRFIGHGIGLELDEIPVIAGRFDTPLEKGNCIAVEPKIIIPGKGGTGLENTYRITENGFEKFTAMDEELIII